MTRRLTAKMLVKEQTVYEVCRNDYDDFESFGLYADKKTADGVCTRLNKKEEEKTYFQKPWWFVDTRTIENFDGGEDDI